MPYTSPSHRRELPGMCVRTYVLILVQTVCRIDSRISRVRMSDFRTDGSTETTRPGAADARRDVLRPRDPSQNTEKEGRHRLPSARTSEVAVGTVGAKREPPPFARRPCTRTRAHAISGLFLSYTGFWMRTVCSVPSSGIHCWYVSVDKFRPIAYAHHCHTVVHLHAA